METLTVHLKAESVVCTALRSGILDLRKGVCLFRSHPYLTGLRTNTAVAEGFPHDRRGLNPRRIRDWHTETPDCA